MQQTTKKPVCGGVPADRLEMNIGRRERSDDHALAAFRFPVNPVRCEVHRSETEGQLHHIEVAILRDEMGDDACRERRVHETVAAEASHMDQVQEIGIVADERVMIRGVAVES